MITKATDHTRYPTRRSRPGPLAIGLGFGLCLGLGSAPGTGTEAHAAKMSSAATNAPLKYPTYLNSDGNILSGSSTTHALAAKDKSKAAYVAYKLKEGAVVSKSIPLMRTKAPIATAARQAIATVTTGVGKMAVKTQSGLYLIDNVHHKSVASSHKVSTSHVAVQAQQLATTTTPTATPSTTAASAALNLTNPLSLSATQTSPSSSAAAAALTLDSPTTTSTSTVAAQTPTTSASTSTTPITGAVLETPVPEPGTLAFAGLSIVGIALRLGLRRRKAARVA